MAEDKPKRAPACPVVLDDLMSRGDVANALQSMIFTAARNWQRTIVMDRNVRDMIVRALRNSASTR